MLAFGIRYLNGFVAASEPDARERAEWPPHPGRVFMAMVAAHFQTGADPAEREALRWLESLGEAPAISAGESEELALVTHYVPVNDRSGPSKALLHSVPLTRERQPRNFARASLQNDTVHLTWYRAEPSDAVTDALAGLCGKVTRIGHSSSLVQMWLATAEEVREPNWLPDDVRSVLHLRVPSPGTLAELERRYNREAVQAYGALQVAADDDSDKKAQKAARRRLKMDFPDGAPVQLRPELSGYQGYARRTAAVESAVRGTVFDAHPVVLTLQRKDGPYRQLDLLQVLPVVQRWREAILSHANDLAARAQSLLSGHDASDAPLESPHLAFLPLAFVGHPHADGRLLGMGLCLPGGLSREERRNALRAAGRVQCVALGRLGAWRVATDTSAEPAHNLRPATWTAHPAGATHWSSVTPIAFNRHPKAENRAAYQREVATMIAGACQHIGLPEPRDVIVTAVSGHLGVPPAHAFQRLQRKDGSQRRHTHAILVFDQPVCGPIVIGAGRYRGYGFCRPLFGEESKQ
jgi:CRISPR-associated protein Csb2